MTLAGCNGKPRPHPDATYVAQAGWTEYVEHGALARKPVLVGIKATFGAIECRYDLSATDACCTGCEHRRPAGAPP